MFLPRRGFKIIFPWIQTIISPHSHTQHLPFKFTFYVYLCIIFNYSRFPFLQNVFLNLYLAQRLHSCHEQQVVAKHVKNGV